MSEEYWRISLDEVFDHYGIDVSDGLIKDIIHVADMESEACGYLSIPNPKDEEVQRNVPVTNVDIKPNGEIIYYPGGPR